MARTPSFKPQASERRAKGVVKVSIDLTAFLRSPYELSKQISIINANPSQLL